jgi:hypothetical protein
MVRVAEINDCLLECLRLFNQCVIHDPRIAGNHA